MTSDKLREWPHLVKCANNRTKKIVEACVWGPSYVRIMFQGFKKRRAFPGHKFPGTISRFITKAEFNRKFYYVEDQK